MGCEAQSTAIPAGGSLRASGSAFSVRKPDRRASWAQGKHAGPCARDGVAGGGGHGVGVQN